ncbi:MAG: helix-turn-helix transcriptional regulator [Actinomycetota bacterium]|nr:helix-turn-helix transcriptional regulator [Actinomycetota bacterium]
MAGTLEDLLYEARMRRGLPDPAMRKLLRARAGVSQQAIADEVGCSREEISRYEAGRRTPRGRFLVAYVAVLDRLVRELSE